LITKNKL